MTLIELFIPNGALDTAAQEELGRRLIMQLISAPGAPAEMIERGRSVTQLVVHEPSTWVVGGPAAAPDPRFIVRVTVPGGHVNDGMRSEMVARITRVLAQSGDAPGRLYEEPRAWVFIDEMPDGNVGAFGQILSTADITDLVVRGSRPLRPAEIDHDGPVTVIDPICGMTVALTRTAITWEHLGQVHGFCSPVCRDAFQAQVVEQPA